MTTSMIVKKALTGYDKRLRKMEKKAWVIAYCKNYPGFTSDEEDIIAAMISEEWKAMKHGNSFPTKEWKSHFFSVAHQEKASAWNWAKNERTFARRHDSRAAYCRKQYDSCIRKMKAAAKLGDCSYDFEHVRYELL